MLHIFIHTRLLATFRASPGGPALALLIPGCVCVEIASPRVRSNFAACSSSGSIHHKYIFLAQRGRGSVKARRVCADGGEETRQQQQQEEEGGVGGGG